MPLIPWRKTQSPQTIYTQKSIIKEKHGSTPNTFKKTQKDIMSKKKSSTTQYRSSTEISQCSPCRASSIDSNKNVTYTSTQEETSFREPPSSTPSQPADSGLSATSKNLKESAKSSPMISCQLLTNSCRTTSISISWIPSPTNGASKTLMFCSVKVLNEDSISWTWIPTDRWSPSSMQPWEQ